MLLVVAAIRVFPVAHLPIADFLIGVERINEVAPSLGACNGVSVTKALLALLEKWKDTILKLRFCAVKGNNGVEL
jgi:hypothetical protein